MDKVNEANNLSEKELEEVSGGISALASAGANASAGCAASAGAAVAFQHTAAANVFQSSEAQIGHAHFCVPAAGSASGGEHGKGWQKLKWRFGRLFGK